VTKQPLPLAVEHWKAKCEAAERREARWQAIAQRKHGEAAMWKAIAEAMVEDLNRLGTLAGETEPDDAGADSWT